MNNLSTTTNELSERISAAALKLEDKVIAWRRGPSSRMRSAG